MPKGTVPSMPVDASTIPQMPPDGQRAPQAPAAGQGVPQRNVKRNVNYPIGFRINFNTTIDAKLKRVCKLMKDVPQGILGRWAIEEYCDRYLARFDPKFLAQHDPNFKGE
jgi:hypothetical protein